MESRIFVGNIHNDFESCLGELLVRFSRFGEVRGAGFEKHATFAFLNMSFESVEKLHKLRSSFNNVKFKGNLLKVDVAKPDWQEAWKLRQPIEQEENELLEKRALEHSWRYYKKLENINMTWDERKNTISGRMRQTPRQRAQLRNVTFRVNVNGSLKVYKCYKTKLWGYERNRELRDLVANFSGGKWWNGYNHIVDRLNYTRSKRSVRFMDANSNTLTVSQTDATENTPKDEGDDINELLTEQEKEKNNGVLNELLQGFDLDKPMAVIDSDEAEVFGISDHEDENYAEEEPSENAGEDVTVDERPAEQMDEEEQDDFVPTFGQTERTNVNNTETLRSLFNPERQQPASGFKLLVDNDDIDETKDIAETVESEAEVDNIQDEPEPKRQKNENRLFFPHFDSPFLVGQTQLSHICGQGTTEDVLSSWDEQFWENRGGWMREMKSKRRDAQRQARKRKSKDGNFILI
ncbi:Nop8p KNAG_0K02620 [Huiozyma naganishii CBS 8797]|uniref:RRM domain-containing protein n=1 Tax=Huiozyma naganishii (strain ATCC MYA-139 / BCRC 22969 / CBS 8797 / KCTC 17520 / NBRC 10181 / NCYC 3082 / Yp74L-3) TaxID=1071383 RepID=J7RCM8_HUIN7|nr:hypothetical protein KNAG_0K02620 [Kazachstania naganishii CBS 8797]CCK72625.1 hypothetical protein KNAG_0K02620 [Kazachstania naganishii CBS 8797]